MQETTNDNMAELQTMAFKQMQALNEPDVDLEKQLKKANAFVQLGTMVINANKVQIDAVRVANQAKLKQGKLIPVQESKPKRIAGGKWI